MFVECHNRWYTTGTVLESINLTHNSQISSMIIGYYDSIVGYNSGIHKWSVKRVAVNGNGNIRGIRSIGVISPRCRINELSLGLSYGKKWDNTSTGSHFDGQSEYSRWKSDEIMTVVLNCNEWKVVYYKTTIKQGRELVEPIKQDNISQDRSYFFALLVDPFVYNEYGVKWGINYQCVKTPHACTRFFNFV